MLGQNSRIATLFIVVSLIALTDCDGGGGGGVSAVDSYTNLGECSALYEGIIRFVTDENQYYRCVDGGWVVTDAPVKSSSSNESLFPDASTEGCRTRVGGNSARVILTTSDCRAEYVLTIVGDSVKEDICSFDGDQPCVYSYHPREGQTISSLKNTVEEIKEDACGFLGDYFGCR